MYVSRETAKPSSYSSAPTPTPRLWENIVVGALGTVNCFIKKHCWLSKTTKPPMTVMTKKMDSGPIYFLLSKFPVTTLPKD